MFPTPHRPQAALCVNSEPSGQPLAKQSSGSPVLSAGPLTGSLHMLGTNQWAPPPDLQSWGWPSLLHHSPKVLVLDTPSRDPKDPPL